MTAKQNGFHGCCATMLLHCLLDVNGLGEAPVASAAQNIEKKVRRTTKTHNQQNE